jgi:hypothetical protein
VAGKLLKFGYIKINNCIGALQTIVVPASPVTDFEALVATLDAVSGVALAVVSSLGHVHVDAGDK